MSVISAPLDWVELVSDLRLPPRADRRLQDLMDRNTKGKLSADESANLESLVELSETLSLVRAKHSTCWAAFQSEFLLGQRIRIRQVEETFDLFPPDEGQRAE